MISLPLSVLVISSGNRDLALELTILKKWITNFRNTTMEAPSGPDNILP